MRNINPFKKSLNITETEPRRDISMHKYHTHFNTHSANVPQEIQAPQASKISKQLKKKYTINNAKSTSLKITHNNRCLIQSTDSLIRSPSIFTQNLQTLPYNQVGDNLNKVPITHVEPQLNLLDNPKDVQLNKAPGIDAELQLIVPSNQYDDMFT